MTPDVTDEHLVERAQGGDKEAFLVLYNRYLTIVYNRVKSRVPQRDAEDVTQEIFIAVVRSLDRFEYRSKFSTWLYTIVSRQIADYHRKAYRGLEREAVSLDEHEGLDLPAKRSQTDSKLMVHQAMGQLPEHYQEVILLRFANGLTFAEIADEIGKSLEATKSQYRRAIQAMTDLVGEA